MPSLDISTVKAHPHFYQYSALPNAEEIVSRMCLAKTAAAAVKSIQEARDEAWRIRHELAKTWDKEMVKQVLKLAFAELEKSEVPLSLSQEAHPIIGPLLKRLYPHGISGAAKIVLSRQLALVESFRKEDQNERLKENHRAGAQLATASRERKLILRCVEGYILWSGENGEKISIESSRRFPGIPGKMTEKRKRELLGTLIISLENNLLPHEVLQLLNDQKKPTFGNVTEDTIGDCLATLKKASMDKIVLERTFYRPRLATA